MRLKGSKKQTILRVSGKLMRIKKRTSKGKVAKIIKKQFTNAAYADIIYSSPSGYCGRQTSPQRVAQPPPRKSSNFFAAAVYYIIMEKKDAGRLY